MPLAIFSAVAIFVSLARVGYAQADFSNSTVTLKASKFAGTSTANSYPPTGSK